MRPCFRQCIAVMALAFGVASCGGDKPDAASDASGDEARRPFVSDDADTSNRLNLAPAAAVDTSGWRLQPPFYAAGTEPFWRLDLEDNWFTFKRSGLAQIEAPFVAPVAGQGSDIFESGPLKIEIRPGACSLDAGGEGQAAAFVTFDEVVYDGCAYQTDGQTEEAAAAAATVWTDSIPDHLIAIDACLARLGAPATVVAIYPREDDLTAVGLRANTGRLYECGATRGLGEVAFLDPVEPSDQPGWVNPKERFLREPDSQPPPKACLDSGSVMSGDTLVGYMLKASCRY